MRTLLAATAAVLAITGTAFAASQTVDGDGDIKKMKVVNGTKAVKVVLFGLDELCGGTRQANATIYWGKAAYEYDGICPSGEWADGLFYHADRSASDTVLGKEVKCPKLSARYADGAVRIRVPRSCLKEAANRIRVKAQGHNFGTMMPGEAGPTKRLARG